MNILDDLKVDAEKATYLQNMLIARATGNDADDSHYQSIRNYFLAHPVYSKDLPSWLKTNRDLSQFWQFIKQKNSTYNERRAFIWEELGRFIESLEPNRQPPSDKPISEQLKNFDTDGIHYAWSKALERRSTDPDGAITIARSILESVCKHILDRKNIAYDSKNMDLSELYKMAAQELNLAPEQHVEKIFKQILGGCSGVINGLGSLRNKLGDAHGQGVVNIKPRSRHAELAVNLSGTMALFLIQTFEENSKNDRPT